jgi:outer membrane murein-binding lipoprotein Lpp
MVRFAFVTMVLVALAVFFRFASVSPAQSEKADPANQMKSLSEEVRRLSAKVGELEKQVAVLRTASKRGYDPDPAPLMRRIETPDYIIEQSLTRDSLPWKVDVPPSSTRFSWNCDTATCVLRSYPDGDPIRWNDGEPLYSTQFPWWTPPSLSFSFFFSMGR